MRHGASWAVFSQICWLVTVLLRASCQFGSSAVLPESSLDGTACHRNDTCTLLEFKAKLGNGGEPMLQSWNGFNLSSWKGVKWIRVASGEFRVQELNLSGLGLNGTDIAPLLHAGLTNLVRLDISNNSFNARIPDPLGICPSLSVLDLQNNKFYGNLPQNIVCDGGAVNNSTLNLRVFNLSHNNISGELSSSLFSSTSSPIPGLLTNVSHLLLEGNNFSGSIPLSIRNCHALVELNLASNSFSGPIPFDSLGSLRNLQSLDLSNNRLKDSLNISKSGGGFGQLTDLLLGGNLLRGTVPDEIGNLTNLVNLNLAANSFTGLVPPFLGNLTKLASLNLASNKFFGRIPFDALGTLRGLTILNLDNNTCTGTIGIPADGGIFPGLETFVLSSNYLTGPIPEVLGNLSNLGTLNFQYNNLSGPIPAVLGNLSNLGTLNFQYNNLTGEIPPSLSRLSKLQILRLSFNKLNGTIPAEFSQLINLVTLSVNHNEFTGALPHLGNCTRLTSMWMGENHFIGSIPAELGSLPTLTVLSLFGNIFSGTIPIELTQLQNLVVFDVSFNSLTGPIPEKLCRLSHLLVLLLNNNQLVDSIPSCFGNFSYVRYLDLSFNSLSGELPSNVSNLSQLNFYQAPTVLNSANYIQDVLGRNLVWQFATSPVSWAFTNNQLSGPIPTGFGNNIKLQQLHLQNNSLSGPIPDSLGGDLALYSLDLSWNHLNGSIPKSLTNLTFLAQLDLSFNNLSGPIPEERQFSTLSASSFAGNPFLCGTVLNRVCNPTGSPGNARAPKSGNDGGPFRKLLPLYIILASAVLCFCFLGCLFVWSWVGGCPRRCTSLVSNDGDAFDSKDDLRVFHFTMSSALHRFDRRELAFGTDNFNESNIIGDGGFGLVYKARLNNGSVVAVKKLTEAGIQGQAEFLAETRTLGKIKKHRNLISLLGYCAYDNERLLVYEYMENGSLDTWLHCREEGMTSLEWGTRLKVARGAAEGLAFLHHDMTPSIIHRDIKASNILLGCDFEAHLADFGLARSAEVYESHVSTDVAGTAGYIPPEYSQTSAATTKGDVYSFGVVLLEILTGRRPMDPFFKNKDMAHVVNWIFDIDWSTEDAVTKTLDVTSAASPDEMLELMRIACMCCQGVPSKRPTMQQIVRMLRALEKHQGSSRSPSVVLYDESMSSPRCR